MSREKQIEEMAKALTKYEKGLCERLPKDKCLLTSAIHAQVSCDYCKIAEFLYNAGYRKQNNEELIDKIATYFEEEENWERLMRGTWNVCGNSVQLRDMLRDAICGVKMKGGAE